MCWGGWGCWFFGLQQSKNCNMLTIIVICENQETKFEKKQREGVSPVSLPFTDCHSATE